MTKITVSAPGKLMLLGEHAVVYNHPCLVTAVDQRMTATVEKTHDALFRLDAPDVHISRYVKPISEIGSGNIPKGAQFVEVAVKNVYKKYHLSEGVSIETSSEFSALFGFGSSSASTVCVVKALSELFNLRLNEKDIFDLAYATVLDIQGKGSGFDIAAAVYGGTLYFVTGGQKIEKLPIQSVPLIIGYSGLKADTVTLINKVAEKAKKYPEVIQNTYEQIDKLVELAKDALIKGDWQRVGELIDINQGYLELLGVSTQKLSSMIYAARDNGAFGAKLSGAGGGDCMIALAPKDTTNSVQKAIEQAGGTIISVKPNDQGVRIET